MNSQAPLDKLKAVVSPDRLKELFNDLIWPAIAGSVAWSFITVLLEERGWEKSCFVRLLTLLLLTVYLMASWLRDKLHAPSEKPYRYYLLDGLFALSIATFAIATSLDNKQGQIPIGWVNASLAAIFAFAALGHWCKIWPFPNRRLAEFETIGFIVAMLQWLLPDNWRPLPISEIWYRPAIMSVVIIVWAVARWPKNHGTH